MKFELNGITYRTNDDATVIEALDGKNWNQTYSLTVRRAARSALWAKWTTAALDWELRAAKYGEDMLSSKQSCLVDAAACRQRAAAFAAC